MHRFRSYSPIKEKKPTKPLNRKPSMNGHANPGKLKMMMRMQQQQSDHPYVAY